MDQELVKKRADQLKRYLESLARNAKLKVDPLVHAFLQGKSCDIKVGDKIDQKVGGNVDKLYYDKVYEILQSHASQSHHKSFDQLDERYFYLKRVTENVKELEVKLNHLLSTRKCTQL